MREVTRRHIRDDCNLDSHCRGSLKTLKADRQKDPSCWGWKMDERGGRIFLFQ